jgi:hypothetical protein
MTVAAVAAPGVSASLPQAQAGVAGAQYGPPYQAGPQGGDQFNTVTVDPGQGTVTILRAYPFVGVFNCGGTGGYGSLKVTPTLRVPVQTVVVAYANSGWDGYTWLMVLVRDASGNWLGSKQVRGPTAGSGVVSVPLATTVTPGSTISVQFGLQVASACPNVDGGTVRFASVSVGGGGSAAPRPPPPAPPLVPGASTGPSAAVTTVNHAMHGIVHGVASPLPHQ